MTIARIGFFGPMLGGYVGRVPSPAETLRPFLAEAGFAVSLVSNRRTPAGRAIDTASQLAIHGRSLDLAIVLVYSGRGFIASLAAARQAHLHGIPVVLHLHGGNLPAYVASHPRRTQILRACARAVVAPSPFLAEVLPGIPGCIIPNMVDVPDHVPDRSRGLRPRILWMRTFEDLYRPFLAIRAFALFRADHPEATMTMAGEDRGLLESARELAVDLAVDDGIRFPGFLDASAKRQAFQDHDIFLNTTSVDNAPVSIVEAMSWGLGIVASATGGVPDLVESDHEGLLVGSAAPADYAAAMESALDPTVGARLSKAARRKAERSAPGVVVPQWIELINAHARGRAG